MAQAVQVVRKIDPRTPIVVSFDQPWGEYLVDQEHELAPLHYADALVRADLGISGFGLEMNAGYWPRGTAHRPVGRLLARADEVPAGHLAARQPKRLEPRQHRREPRVVAQGGRCGAARLQT